MAEGSSEHVQVVTISAAYGAGGSLIGPGVAQRLAVPFLDRAIPAAVARTLDVPLDEVLSRDERRPSMLERIMSGLAASGGPLGVTPTATAGTIATEDAFRATTEQVLRELAKREGAVVLGRAGAVVLAEHPSALHVRLTGPRSARIEVVMAHERLARDAAAKLLDATDRAWESYVRYFYKADPRDPALYHLVIDSTAISLEVCSDIIAAAARAR